MNNFRLTTLLLCFVFYFSSGVDAQIDRKKTETEEVGSTKDNGGQPTTTSPQKRKIHEGRGIRFYHDNDNSFLQWGYNEDRNYTAGLGLEVSGKYMQRLHFVDNLRKGVDWLFRVNQLHKNAVDGGNDGSSPINRNYAFISGFSGFTPENLKDSLVITNDRPYGSILYFSDRRTSAQMFIPSKRFKEQSWSITSEFVFALLGTNVARDFQTYAHTPDTFVSTLVGNNRPIPKGWHNQISNGGELSALYRLNYTRLLRSEKWKHIPDRRFFDFATYAEGMLGYYTNFGVGINAKIGFFNTPFWNSMSTSGASKTLADDKNFNKFQRWLANNVEVFAFSNMGTRLIGYNALLQGQLKKNAPHTFKSQEINRVINEVEIGMALRVKKFNFSWHPIIQRSSEYNGSQSRKHRWGTFSLSWVWESGNPAKKK